MTPHEPPRRGRPWLVFWVAAGVTALVAALPRFPLGATLAPGLVTVVLGLRASRAGRNLQVRQRQWLEASRCPSSVRSRVSTHYPSWTLRDLNDVEHGLRQFFIACLEARGQYVAMPSKAVDAMWHEFLLHTAAYAQFCDHAFGKMLHHHPAEAMPEGSAGRAAEGLRRAWRSACAQEGINPLTPSRLPLLFALDARLEVPGGHRYVAEELARRRADGSGQCVTGCGGGSSSGSSNGDGPDGGTGSDGCGGGSCGGGGGGD